MMRIHNENLIEGLRLREKPYITFYTLLTDAEKYQERKDSYVEDGVLAILETKIAEYRSELKKKTE